MDMPKTILLKISGEYLGDASSIFSQKNTEIVAKVICNIMPHYDGVYVVIGGGNIARGRELKAFKFRNGSDDIIGMLSTVQNAAILKSVLDNLGQKSHVMAPFSAPMLQIEPYESTMAIRLAVRKKHVVIFGAGLGICGFSTDTTAVSRAYEVGADIVVKITEVGAMFTADPKKNRKAGRIPSITYNEVIAKEYKIMDASAIVFARTHNKLIKITGLEPLNLVPEMIMNDCHGTIIRM